MPFPAATAALSQVSGAPGPSGNLAAFFFFTPGAKFSLCPAFITRHLIYRLKHIFGITSLSFAPRNSLLRAREFFFWEEETKELCYDVADHLQNWTVRLNHSTLSVG